VAAQRALCEQVMRCWASTSKPAGWTCRTHPFCGGVPEDVRMTTRFRDDDFLGSLMGTVHETGHGRYEQNLPRDWLGQPVAEARSMALHESQSLSFEMQLGSHPGFVNRLAPLMAQAFGASRRFAPANLHRLLTRVKPGFIRVDADEVTYPAHIILRYEIERPLIEGEIEPEDVPALWDAKMHGTAGHGHARQLQGRPAAGRALARSAVRLLPVLFTGRDVLGAVVCRHAPRHARPGRRIGAGTWRPVFDWLRDNIWTQASRWTTDELARAPVARC
jgi:carboxypeptidase Taq